MISTRKTTRPPSNIDHYIDELGVFVGSIYGHAGEAAYRRNAVASLPRVAGHPDVRMWAAGDDDAAGFAMCVVRRNVAYLNLFHVLRDARGRGVELALARAVHDTLTREGVAAIVGEFVGDHGMALAETFAPLGYQRFERMLMSADLADERLQGAPGTSSTYVCNEWAADVLVDAYRDHPSRPMHPETHSRASAVAFLETFQSGAFGATHEHYYRAEGPADPYDGIITGAEAAPDVGFVLHVATKRATQGKGIGKRLLLDLAEVFRQDGYSRVALGVTCGNRAERLYTRLGFSWLAPVETYVWWADPGQSC